MWWKLGENLQSASDDLPLKCLCHPAHKLLLNIANDFFSKNQFDLLFVDLEALPSLTISRENGKSWHLPLLKRFFLSFFEVNEFIRNSRLLWSFFCRQILLHLLHSHSVFWEEKKSEILWSSVCLMFDFLDKGDKGLWEKQCSLTWFLFRGPPLLAVPCK